MTYVRTMSHEHGPHWRVVCVPCAEAYWSRVPDLVCSLRIPGRPRSMVNHARPPDEYPDSWRAASDAMWLLTCRRLTRGRRTGPGPGTSDTRLRPRLGSCGGRVVEKSRAFRREPHALRCPHAGPSRFRASDSNSIPMWTAVLLLDEAERIRLITLYLDNLAGYPVGHRSNRIEPRAIKRRPKSHRLLTKPHGSTSRQESRGSEAVLLRSSTAQSYRPVREEPQVVRLILALFRHAH